MRIFAVLRQFCAEVITLSAFDQTQNSQTVGL